MPVECVCACVKVRVYLCRDQVRTHKCVNYSEAFNFRTKPRQLRAKVAKAVDIRYVSIYVSAYLIGISYTS